MGGDCSTGERSRISEVPRGIDLAISAPEATADQWLELTDALDEAPIICKFDVVRTERAHHPRLIARIAREGVAIYPENPTA
jgi:hypothetical protein